MAFWLQGDVEGEKALMDIFIAVETPTGSNSLVIDSDHVKAAISGSHKTTVRLIGVHW